MSLSVLEGVELMSVGNFCEQSGADTISGIINRDFYQEAIAFIAEILRYKSGAYRAIV